jgi:hypothetical protein
MSRYQERLIYAGACDALVREVRAAANPSMPEFVPYKGVMTVYTAWFARVQMREAIRLGLYTRDEDAIEESRRRRCPVTRTA